MIRCVALLLLLLAGIANAERSGDSAFSGKTLSGKEENRSPRPNDSAQQRPSFSETRRVVGAAIAIVQKLGAGEPVIRATPQGQRLMLPLLFGDQVVAYVLLRADGTLAPLSEGPQLPGNLTVLSSAARTKLAAQVATLTVSGGIDASPRDYFVTLLVGGQAVGQLRLDPRSLQPRPEMSQKPPKGRH